MTVKASNSKPADSTLIKACNASVSDGGTPTVETNVADWTVVSENNITFKYQNADDKTVKLSLTAAKK